MDDEERTEHCTVAEPVNLRSTLEATGIEHLAIDESRIIVIST